jgi:hypothetical protein
MRVRTIITVAAALWGVSTAALLATVSAASAVLVTETWYLGSTAGSPITSYDFGSVPNGSNPSVTLILKLSPAVEITGYSTPSTTSPFSIGTFGSSTCGTDFCINVQTFFNPLSPGPYSENLGVPFTISGFDPTASIPLNGTGVSPVPLPAALPLFATGLGALGLLGWRRKRKAQAA